MSKKISELPESTSVTPEDKILVNNGGETKFVKAETLAVSFLPTGIIFPFAGDEFPSGWLPCDGRAVSRTAYPKLFAAIKTLHGAGDGSTTFHLPDYRGRFLRGADSMANGPEAGRDLDRASRTAANAGGASGAGVGSVQNSATKRPNTSFGGTISGTSATAGWHDHATDYYWWTNDTGSSHATAANNNGGHMGRHGYSGNTNRGNVHANANGNHTHSVSGSASVTTGGDLETRPENANVNYMIKA